MDKNHGIALYLTGKYPGFFRTPDKLLFIDCLQAINLTVFSDERIKMLGIFGQVDEFEFYLSHLNKVEKGFPSDYSGLLEKLEIPQELVLESDSKFDRSKLLAAFDAVRKNNSTTKGTAFENFLKEFFGSIDGLEILEVKLMGDEQIDLVLKNNINRPFWLQLGSPIILGEAKNWTEPTKTEVFNTLRGKMTGHKNFSRIGIVIALNEFTSEVEKNMIRDGSSDAIVFPITGKEISELLDSNENPIDWLESKLISAFK